MSILLVTRDLSIGYLPERHLLTDTLNLSIAAGELTCLLGVNGAGKSTLIRTLAGMQQPLSGEIVINGNLLHRTSSAELARQVSIVLTERIDPGLLTARELIALGRYPYTNWIGSLSRRDREVVEWAIHLVGAEKLADRPVAQLSDGERQKVLIGRALAQDTPLIILDEPTAFLDLPRRAEIMHMLRRLAHSTGKAVLLSTHDLESALRCADRLWLFGADGRLSVGIPEDLVLSGAFEAAFSDQGVRFDLVSGTFAAGDQPLGKVRLVGEGLEALWTRRALERLGYALDSGAQDIVEVSGRRWRGQIKGRRGEWHSIGEFVEWLRTA